MKHKPSSIIIAMPTNVWKNTELVSMLDRTKLSSFQATGVYSAAVKSATSSDIEKVEFNEGERRGCCRSNSRVQREETPLLCSPLRWKTDLKC